MFLVILLLLLMTSPARAQQPQTIDPRLAGPMVQALQAQIALAQAAMKAMQEDQAKKDADLAKWFEEWFGTPPNQDGR